MKRQFPNDSYSQDAKRVRYGNFTDWNKIVHTSLPLEQTQEAGQDDEPVQIGAGIINWAVNHLPVEMHLYSNDLKKKYNFCG